MSDIGQIICLNFWLNFCWKSFSDRLVIFMAKEPETLDIKYCEARGSTQQRNVLPMSKKILMKEVDLSSKEHGLYHLKGIKSSRPMRAPASERFHFAVLGPNVCVCVCKFYWMFYSPAIKSLCHKNILADIHDVVFLSKNSRE